MKKILYIDMKKNISRSNSENPVDQFFDDVPVKIYANFWPIPKKSNAPETFLLLCNFSFNVWISQEIIHKLR